MRILEANRHNFTSKIADHLKHSVLVANYNIKKLLFKISRQFFHDNSFIPPTNTFKEVIL